MRKYLQLGNSALLVGDKGGFIVIRIAICDDEKIYNDLIFNCLSRIIREKYVEASIVKYISSQMLINDHKQNPFDILFLDIDMPIASGFDVSKVVREMSNQSYIVFISAKHEMVYNSFEYNPFYFICKTNRNNLFRELEHVFAKLIQHFQQHRKIQIFDTSCGTLLVRLQDIVYIKSDKHYLQYYMRNRETPYLERSTLSKKEAEINCPDFLKPHQRYLVNMNHIEKFGGLINTILLDNNHQVPISKALKEVATQTYIIYKRR